DGPGGIRWDGGRRWRRRRWWRRWRRRCLLPGQRRAGRQRGAHRADGHSDQERGEEDAARERKPADEIARGYSLVLTLHGRFGLVYGRRYGFDGSALLSPCEEGESVPPVARRESHACGSRSVSIFLPAVPASLLRRS